MHASTKATESSPTRWFGGVATDAARGYLSPEDFAAAATPQEVADTLAFLASDRGSGVNGALVDLNAREVD